MEDYPDTLVCHETRRKHEKLTIEMKKTSLLLFIVFLHNTIGCLGQDLISKLNDLPPSAIQKAPFFDVEKKYLFSFDSTNNSLFVQALARNPKNLEAHVYQDIFEIPLADINAGSFLLLKKNDSSPKITLQIGTKNNKQSIISYLLIQNQVEMVQVRDVLSIGDWSYTEQLYSEIKDIINLLCDRFSDKSDSTTFSGLPRTVFKYFTDRIVAVGNLEPDRELNRGYYYVASLQKASFYDGKNNSINSNSALIKDLKTELRRLNGNLAVPTPVMINVDKSGQIESIFYLNQKNDVNRNINLKNFKSFNPGSFDSQNVKSKTLLIIN